MANDKTARAELIASLVTDRYSGFKDGDEAFLEAASDARLEEFRANSERHKTAQAAHARLETESVQVTARLKVAEERLKASEQELSEEDFLRRAPASIKSVVEAHKAEEADYRASLVSQLKEKGVLAEEALKAKSTDELKTLAAFGNVHVPNFSGRGVPQERNSSFERKDYGAPDPYAAGLKALREKAAH